MTKKLRIPLLLLLLSILALGGLAFGASIPFFQVETPTPNGQVIEVNESEPILVAQVGSSDGIALLGIVIFVMTVGPIWVLRNDI